VDVAHLLSHPPATDPRRAFYAQYGLEGNGGEDLVGEPRRVTLMRRGARVGERIGPSTRWAVVDALKRAGVEIITGVQYARIEPDAVLIREMDGPERRVPAQTVIVAAGQQSETALAGALRATGMPHVVIGGAADAGELDAERAFREGSQTPRAVAQVLGAPSW
jgi:2,4-dienoyl-CoA reductase (NADPH2)